MTDPITLKFDPTERHWPLTWYGPAEAVSGKPYFCGELSELGQISGVSGCAALTRNTSFSPANGSLVRVLNTRNGNRVLFECYSADTDGSGEDVYGWHFRAISGHKFPCELLIIND